MVDERNTPTTAGARSKYSSIGKIEDRNQEQNRVQCGLGPGGAGKTFVSIDERLVLIV